MKSSTSTCKSWILLSLGLILFSFASLSAQVTVSPTLPNINTFLWGNTSVNAVGKTSFVSGTGYGYRYLLPKNFNPNTKYPVIIFLHGEGERGTDNNLQLSVANNTANGILALVSTANPDNQTNYPCFLILPQEPVGNLWSSDVSATAIQNLLHIFETQYPTAFDTSRIYVTGLSEGGTGSYDMPYLMAQSNHLGYNPFAAIVPQSGSFGYYIARPFSSQPFMPIWAFHAANDATAPIGGSDDASVSAFRALGYSVIYTRYLTGGHQIWQLAYQHPQLLPWLFSQKLGQSTQPPFSNFAVTGATQSSGPLLNLSGTAATSVLPFSGLSWSNSTNSQSGTASGAVIPTWSIPGIPLVAGTNVLQVTASAPNNTALVFGSPANYGGTLTVNLPLDVSPSLNIALNKTVTVSSVDAPQNSGANAVDGNTNTRWASSYSDPQWIQVDLGAYYAISEVDLNWETACGKNYQIQTSNDGVVWTTQTNVTGNTSRGLLAYPYATPPIARYVRMYGTARATTWGYSLWEFSIYSDGIQQPPPTNLVTNIALNMPVTVSSTDAPQNSGANAVDGNLATRWASAWSDPQWIDVDLGANYNISEIDLNWETACGKNYLLQTSTDNVNWTTVTTVTGNTTTGLLQYPYSTPITGRYVRMYGTARATNWGYSLWEFSIYSNGTLAGTQPPTIANGPPPATGMTGVTYNFSYSSGGSPAPTFSVTSGSLPPGLGLSNSGVISGTPTGGGVFSGTVTATNGINPVATQNFSITVSQAPAITNGPPPATATTGTAYSFAYTASGYPAPTFTVTPGSLPPGLTLSSSGVLSGTPTSGGVFAGTVTASNGVNPTASQDFSITVSQPPGITNGPPPATGTTGINYNFSYVATGYPVPSFSVTSGSLPPGLTLSPAGVLSGAPTTVGVFTGSITASNGVNPAVSQNFSITVGLPPATGTNLALNQPVTVSSTDAPQNGGSNAVDGNLSSRWSSAYSDPQWIVVDLGADYAISEVDLNWETACGKNYLIQTSIDNVNWTTLTTVTGNTTSGLLQYPYSNPIVGRYVRMYGTARATQWGYSLWEFAVYGTLSANQTPPVITNLALNQPVTVSSTEVPQNSGANAVDGNLGTRWASAYSDPQFIQVDLGVVRSISEVDLNWETACGRDYQIQTSLDGVNWTTQTNVTGNTTSGLLQYPFANAVSGRYVRMYGTARATVWGYSLWEFAVYGQ